MRKTYAEKLRDPRWLRFKKDFLDWRSSVQEKNPNWCDQCGEETEGCLHVHHNWYYTGYEPWEYDFEEMNLYCEDCHERIHSMERDFAGFIRSIQPHECYEMRQVLQAMESARYNGVLKVALAHAKNRIDSISRRGGAEE